MSWIGSVGSFFDLRFPVAGPGGFGFPGWGGVGGSYSAPRTVSVYSPWIGGAGSPAGAITASRELPGSTHWDPAPVPVGDKAGGKSGAVIEGGGLPGVDILGAFLPDFRNEGQPPIIYSPPPVVLPGQTDPGREEQESEEGEMAHTWTHVGSQLLGALFPSTVAAQSFVAGPGQGVPAGTGPLNNEAAAAVAAANGGAMYETGSCARKTRTLTIDCATGLEVKRKRRRRRALLTQGDMGVLFQIASLPNNANVRVALAGAIRR